MINCREIVYCLLSVSKRAEKFIIHCTDEAIKGREIEISISRPFSMLIFVGSHIDRSIRDARIPDNVVWIFIASVKDISTSV